MAIHYAGLRRTADRLLRENGISYRLIRQNIKLISGIEVQLPEQIATVTGIISCYTRGEVDGTLIQQGDSKMMATAETAICQGDRLIIDDKAHRVIQVNPVKPAALLLCYQLQLRG
ncbi:hypothetical protein [Candidatus Regiella endosymbiont of Tuberolachnus salignus]|uniref:hypothetical protein n=1 Tax=Candidatus Regiella endosymbiont of Tuberolachnus salignus TaxID=3077956 RepID=UPI0030D335F7